MRKLNTPEGDRGVLSTQRAGQRSARHDPEEPTMKRSPILLTCLFTCLLTGTAAFAQSTAPRTDDGERHGDRRGAFAAAKFAEADSNHDGAISKSEWQSASLRRAAEHFQKMDGNRDGKLRQEEMAAGPHPSALVARLEELAAGALPVPR
jgi:hypothetical protein